MAVLTFIVGFIVGLMAGAVLGCFLLDIVTEWAVGKD